MRAFQSNHARDALACLVVALAGAAPVQASWTGHPPGKNCVWESGDSGGEEEGAPRNLRPAFYKRAVTLVVSADGLHGQELPDLDRGWVRRPREAREGGRQARRRRWSRATAAPNDRLGEPCSQDRTTGHRLDRGRRHRARQRTPHTSRPVAPGPGREPDPNVQGRPDRGGGLTPALAGLSLRPRDSNSHGPNGPQGPQPCAFLAVPARGTTSDVSEVKRDEGLEGLRPGAPHHASARPGRRGMEPRS